MKLVEEKPHRSSGRRWLAAVAGDPGGLLRWTMPPAWRCLLLACEALDRAEILKAEIKKDGAVLRSETSTHGPRAPRPQGSS